jgi:hypothetical protein
MFMKLTPGVEYKEFFSSSLTLRKNKLECFLCKHFNIRKYLEVILEAQPWTVKLNKARVVALKLFHDYLIFVN